MSDRSATAFRIDLRMIIEQHDDVGTRARLDRRGDPRLKVVAIHGLEVDLEAQRLLGGGQHFLAQELIRSRHEVIPAQPMHGRALRESGCTAGGQDAGHAAHDRGTAFEDGPSGYFRHAFLPGVFGLTPLSVLRRLGVPFFRLSRLRRSTVRTFWRGLGVGGKPGGSRASSIRMCRDVAAPCARAAGDFAICRFLREQAADESAFRVAGALQPALMNATAMHDPSRAAMVLPSPRRFSLSCKKGPVP